MPLSPTASGGARFGEFVALAAAMTSLVALSVDAMLPALPSIGADLGTRGPNDAQLVVSALMLGLGLGQLLYGPLSDAIGRKPAILAGFALFAAGCLLSLSASDFATMIAGRVLQGFGAAGPRIVTVALVRDRFAGRQMARVMSFVMAVFIMVPALAPVLGQGIQALAGWRGIFATFLVIAVSVSAWFALRQPETLPPERRIPLSATRLGAALREVLTTRATIGYTVASGCIFSAFLGYLSSAQQIFQDTYATGERFPAYFAVLALSIGAAAVVNGRMVVRVGMRRMCARAAIGLATLSALFWAAAAALDGTPPLSLFMVSFMAAFFCIGILFGNLTALAMEPLGHIAGIGAAVVGSLSTMMAVPAGIAIGRAYDGTVLALAGGFALFSAAALLVTAWTEAGSGSRTGS